MYTTKTHNGNNNEYKNQTENTEPKLNWVRTGKKLEEKSYNGKGYIIL